MNEQALEQLRELLLDWDDASARVGIEEFSMANWVYDGERECGTACCAGGLAALHGLAGLCIDKDEIVHRPTDYMGWHALAEAFGLTLAEVHRIFDFDGYPESAEITPAVVAANIGLLVSGKGGQL